jgi:hypothetical protein
VKVDCSVEGRRYSNNSLIIPDVFKLALIWKPSGFPAEPCSRNSRVALRAGVWLVKRNSILQDYSKCFRKQSKILQYSYSVSIPCALIELESRWKVV